MSQFKLSCQIEIGSVGRKNFLFLFLFFSPSGPQGLFGLQLELLGVRYTPFCTHTGKIPKLIHLDTIFPSCISQIL